MSVDSAKMLLGEDPCGCNPTLDHLRISPSCHVARTTLDSTLRTLDDVGRRQTLVQRLRDFHSLKGEHLLHPLAQATCGAFMIALQKSRQLLQSFLSFLGGLHFPCCAHQIQRLTMLLFG